MAGQELYCPKEFTAIHRTDIFGNINSNNPQNSRLAVPVTLTIDSTPLVVSFGSISNVRCNGFSIRWHPPHTISWNTGSSSATISGLCQGNYAVTVTDTSGCTANSNITLYEPGLLTLTLDSFNATCGTCADGAINLTVSGGTAPFTYQWSDMSVTQDITGLLPGSYSVTVSDANGCQANGSVMVDFTVGAINNGFETGIFLYPNPANEKFTLLIEGATQGLFEILLLNAAGQQVVKKEISLTGGLSKIEFDTRSYKEGLYLIRISTPEGTWLRKVGIAR